MATDIKNDASLSTSLVSYWELEEASGTRVDSHGSNDLTDNNTVTQGTGIQGNCASFNTANTEHLTILDASQTGLDVAADGALSFSWWNYWNSLPTNFYVINKLTSSTPGYRIQGVGNGGANYILVGWWNTSGGLNRVKTANSTITTGAWEHWVVTIDFSQGASGIKIYKNGSILSDTDVNNGGGDTSTAGTDRFTIGCANADTTPVGGVDGLIDEVGVWNKILSSGEVSDLYNSGSGIPYEVAGGGVNTSRNLLLLGVG